MKRIYVLSVVLVLLSVGDLFSAHKPHNRTQVRQQKYDKRDAAHAVAMAGAAVLPALNLAAPGAAALPAQIAQAQAQVSHANGNAKEKDEAAQVKSAAAVDHIAGAAAQKKEKEASMKVQIYAVRPAFPGAVYMGRYFLHKEVVVQDGITVEQLTKVVGVVPFIKGAPMAFACSYKKGCLALLAKTNPLDPKSIFRGQALTLLHQDDGNLLVTGKWKLDNFGLMPDNLKEGNRAPSEQEENERVALEVQKRSL